MVVDVATFDVVVVNSSGGKDSQVMLDVVARQAEQAGVSGRVTVLHNDMGRMEWEGTLEVAAAQAAFYGLRFEVCSRPGPDLLDYIAGRRQQMWPDARNRYCTSDFKRGPGLKVVTRLVAELGPLGRPARVLYCLGMRGAESCGRAKLPPFELDTRKSSGRREIWRWLPVHDWSAAQVWERIARLETPVHPAYAAGMTRASCSFCVLASKADLILACQLRPQLAGEYERVERQMGHRFQAANSMSDLIAAARAGNSDV